MAHQRPESALSPALLWIDQPKTKQELAIVTERIWRLISSEFYLTVADIARILDCQELWVHQHIKPYVKHIFLNYHFRQHLNKYQPASGFHLSNYYYFSYRDLARWLDKNTKVIRQTILVSASIGSQCPEPDFQNRKGSDLLVLEPIPTKFISMRSILRIFKINSKELVYRKIFYCGLPKYRIADSLTRFDRDISFNKPSSDQVLVWAQDAASLLQGSSIIVRTES